MFVELRSELDPHVTQVMLLAPLRNLKEGRRNEARQEDCACNVCRRPSIHRVRSDQLPCGSYVALRDGPQKLKNLMTPPESRGSEPG